MILALENIECGYDLGRPILQKLDLCIAEQQKVGIIGENGSGKSTISKVVMGMLPVNSGSVIYSGADMRDVPVAARAGLGVGYFFQGGRVFPNLTVEENLKLAVLNTGIEQYQAQLARFEVLSRPKRLKLKAGFLSGGEKNQLALAMAIASVSKLRLLIADEPSAGLSPVNTNAMYQLLQELVEKEGCALLLIEQNLRFARQNADKIYQLKNQKLEAYEK